MILEGTGAGPLMTLSAAVFNGDFKASDRVVSATPCCVATLSVSPCWSLIALSLSLDVSPCWSLIALSLTLSVSP